MTTTDPQAKSQLRRAILRHLYAHQATAPHPISAIAIHIREARLSPTPFTEQDIAENLHMLQGLGLVQDQLDPLGATRSWQLTSNGILFHERNL